MIVSGHLIHLHFFSSFGCLSLNPRVLPRTLDVDRADGVALWRPLRHLFPRACGRDWVFTLIVTSGPTSAFLASREIAAKGGRLAR